MASEHDDLKISDLSVVQFVNCFSLLVVAGSLSTSYFFSQLYSGSLSLSFYWLLGSTVWIIYSLDHILDGIKLKENAISIRHYIHYKYRNVMIPGLIALTVFNALVAYFFLPEKMLKAGLILGLGVVVYFVIIHLLKRHLQWGKELFVSVVVCVGMVVLPGLSGDFSFDLASITIVLCMVFINFTNLILFSYFDYDADMENGLQSAATAWGKERTKSLALHTMATAFFLYLIWTFMVVSPVKLTTSVIFLLMFNVLLIMYVQEERFAQDERYRFWGDFIFLIPGLVWYFLINKPFF